MDENLDMIRRIAAGFLGLDPNNLKKTVTRKAADNEPFAALAFKVMNDPFGNLTFFRVYSGTTKSGVAVMNSSRGKRERFGRILRMHANKREEIPHVACGGSHAAQEFGHRALSYGSRMSARRRRTALKSSSDSGC